MREREIDGYTRRTRSNRPGDGAKPREVLEKINRNENGENTIN